MPVVSEPIFKYRLVVVTAGQSRPRGPARHWRWLVDPAGADPGSETGRLLAQLGVPESNIGVFPSQTAAWAAAADGVGRRTGDRAPGVAAAAAGRAVTGRPARPAGRGCWYATLLEREHRSTAASALRRFLGTPEAMQLMRSPSAGVPPSRFRPPVYVTIWS